MQLRELTGAEPARLYTLCHLGLQGVAVEKKGPYIALVESLFPRFGPGDIVTLKDKTHLRRYEVVEVIEDGQFVVVKDPVGPGKRGPTDWRGVFPAEEWIKA